MHYKVWGDSAVEDYYFYPDGFGTRVLHLKSDVKADYELSEFIILTPQEAYPFAVLPSQMVDVLFADGEKRKFTFPFVNQKDSPLLKAGTMPAVYRIRFNKREELSAIYFNPNDKELPPVFFYSFFDRGEMVTPMYWGSHWPLARGNATGLAIDERIHASPGHNSMISWAGSKPAPLRSNEILSIDTLGRSKPMREREWAWLIGMTDAADSRLLEWARSFSKPPALEISGARFDFNSFIPERRALRLVVEAKTVLIAVKSGEKCLNPVFELPGAPAVLKAVTLADQRLDTRLYAWDGRTLWLDATLEPGRRLRLEFGAMR